MENTYCDWCQVKSVNIGEKRGNYVDFANTNQERAFLCPECRENAFRCELNTCGKLGDKNSTGVYGNGYHSYRCQHTCTSCGGVEGHDPNCINQ